MKHLIDRLPCGEMECKDPGGGLQGCTGTQSQAEKMDDEPSDETSGGSGTTDARVIEEDGLGHHTVFLGHPLQ